MTIVYGVAVALMALALILLVASAVRETQKARERARQDARRAADRTTGPAVQAKRPVTGMSMSTPASGRNPEDGP
jgi:type II secretory pathway pseudopilin PulG